MNIPVYSTMLTKEKGGGTPCNVTMKRNFKNGTTDSWEDTTLSCLLCTEVLFVCSVTLITAVSVQTTVLATCRILLQLGMHDMDLFKPRQITDKCLPLMADTDKINDNLYVCILKRSSQPSF